MPDATLSPSSFIVLGFIDRYGELTSYDLKRCADESVGYFWSFPRSQLYAEPQRLVGLGLLTDDQEEGGRRRRLFRITDAGRAALADWLAAPAGFPELRDLGLLKLFFLLDGPADAARPEVQRLAAEQLALHRERQAIYTSIAEPVPDDRPELRGTLHLGLLYEQACIAFWGVFEHYATASTAPGDDEQQPRAHRWITRRRDT